MKELPSNISDFARDQLWVAKEKTQNIKARLEEAMKVEKVWDDFVRFSSRGWFMHVLDLLNKQASVFHKLEQMNSDVASTLEKARLNSNEACADIIRRYPTYLEEAFREAKLPFDPGSRHPRYTLENRFFLLEIDERKELPSFQITRAN